MRTLITPKRAEEILAKNTSNRKVNEAGVLFIKRAITSGQFKYNGESIIIAKDGTLLDGQHRLMACVQTDTPIDVELIEGVDNDVMPTIDTGTARTAAHVFQIMDIKNGAVVSAGIRNILTDIRLKRGIRKNGNRTTKISNMEILDFYNENKELMDLLGAFSVHQVNIGTKLITSSKLMALVYLLSTISDGKIVIDFFREVLSGIRIRESNLAHLLRKKLIDNKISNTKFSEDIEIRLIIKAFYKYADNEVSKLLKLSTDEIIGFRKGELNIDLDYLKLHSAR